MGTTTPGRTTLAHVARHAGVSTSTASLAFSRAGPVAESTRQRVLDAAAELGYAGPDPTARSLRQGRSGVVGAVVGERLLYAFRDPVAIAMLDGLTEVLGPADSALLLLSGSSEQRGPSQSQVAGLPLDAVVFATCGGDDDPILDQLRRRAVPLIGIEGPHSPDVCLVDIDNRGSSARLARHLLELGHERFGVVALPLLLDGRGGWVDDDRRRLAAYADCRLRLAGVEDAVTHRVPAVEAPSNRIEEGRRAGRLLLDVPAAERPTAVVAQSDLLAVGVVQAAADLGLRVPDDVSVAGYDGIETPWLGNARLTTVVQPSAEKGRAAGRMVLDLLAGRRPADVLLPVRLQVGTTTGPAPVT